jgi:DNA-binding HxlR family transcriptional regulator
MTNKTELDDVIEDVLDDDEPEPAEALGPPPSGLTEAHIRTWALIRALEREGVEDIDSGDVRRNWPDDITGNTLLGRMRQLVDLGVLERDPEAGDPRGYRWYTSARGHEIVLERAAWWLSMGGHDDLAEQVRERLEEDAD